jgi:hypothetical protein
LILGFELRAYNLSPLHQPFFVMDFFRDGVLQIICPGKSIKL